MAHAAARYETRHHRGTALAVHRHQAPYVALVVEGEYWEHSPDGPVHGTPGTLLLHPAFHVHGNRFGSRDVRVLNLALPLGQAPAAAFGAVQLPSVRRAREVLERRPADLQALLQSEAAAAEPASVPPWQQAFATALAEGDEPIGQIARRLGVSVEHASRSLRASFGLSPQALRREWRWRKGLALLRGPQPLAEVAQAAGFADQSHFTRTTRLCSGWAPQALRQQLNCVQDAG